MSVDSTTNIQENTLANYLQPIIEIAENIKQEMDDTTNNSELLENMINACDEIKPEEMKEDVVVSDSYLMFENNSYGNSSVDANSNQQSNSQVAKRGKKRKHRSTPIEPEPNISRDTTEEDYYNESSGYANYNGYKLVDIPVLINFVKNNPCLYDMSHSEFRDVGKKKALWSYIGDYMGVPEEVAKKKWYNIRDAFVQSRRKRETDEGPKKKYKFAHMLGFLVSGLDDNVPVQGQEDAYCKLINEGGMENNAINNMYETNTSKSKQYKTQPTPSSLLPPKKFRKDHVSNDVDQQIVSYLKSKKDLANMNETDYFFKAMADVVNKLPRKLASQTKLKVHSIVCEAELQTME